MSSTNPNPIVSSSARWNSSSSSEIKKRNKIDDSSDFCEIFVLILIQSLLYSVYIICVRLFYKKLAIIYIIYLNNFFSFKIVNSLLYNMLSKAPVKSKLNIDTTHFGRARYAI
jgi:hypothetical protein